MSTFGIAALAFLAGIVVTIVGLGAWLRRALGRDDPWY